MISSLLIAAVIFHPTPPAEILQEDDPRWNCATMGNEVCGTSDGFLIFFEDGRPWSVSTPVNGEPQCGTDAQCEQLIRPDTVAVPN